MYRCDDCDYEFSEYEADYYRLPPKRFCTGWDIDNENMPCCPLCGSLNLVEVKDEDEDDEEI